MDGVTIRQAQLDDVPGIARVQVAGWQWGYAGLMPADYLAALETASREEMWRMRLATDDRRAHVAVALAGGVVVGFVACGRYHLDDLGPGVRPDAVGAVWALYLAKAHQGRGVGRALMTWAVEQLRAAGFTEARLWVLESNALARHFYERQGWAADGARMVDDVDGLALTEVRYSRALPPSSAH